MSEIISKKKKQLIAHEKFIIFFTLFSLLIKVKKILLKFIYLY